MSAVAGESLIYTVSGDSGDKIGQHAMGQDGAGDDADFYVDLCDLPPCLTCNTAPGIDFSKPDLRCDDCLRAHRIDLRRTAKKAEAEAEGLPTSEKHSSGEKWRDRDDNKNGIPHLTPPPSRRQKYHYRPQ